GFRVVDEKASRHHEVTRKEEPRISVVKRNFRFVMAWGWDHVESSITQLDLGESVWPIGEFIEASNAVNIKPNHLHVGSVRKLTIGCTMVEMSMCVDHQ